MRGHVVAAAQRDWSSHALLDSALPGHASELAPVIGHGMTEDRGHAAPVGNPHGFSIEWLRLQPGNEVGRHLLAEKQVAIVFKGAMDVVLNEPGHEVRLPVGTGELFSTPGDTWRRYVARGDAPVEVALITSGDARKRPVWAPEIIQAALAAGVCIDHNGHVAPLELLPPRTRARSSRRRCWRSPQNEPGARPLRDRPRLHLRRHPRDLGRPRHRRQARPILRAAMPGPRRDPG